MCTLFRRLLIAIFLLWGVCAWAQSLNTVPIGQGGGFSPKGVPIPTGCSYAINYPSTNTFVCAATNTATPSSTPTNTPTATPSATPTALADTYFAGQGVGNPSAYNGPFAHCPYGSAYSTVSHNFACAPTPTTTATVTATPSATPTALADTYFAGQGIGSQAAFNGPFTNCPFGSAYSTSSHNLVCAPTPTVTATPTPTTSATPTATTTATPTATPTFAAHAFLVGQGTNVPKPISVCSDGQVPVGATGADPACATVGTGTGISTSTGANSLTVNNTGVTSNVATANQTAVSAGTGAVTLSLAGPHNFATETNHGILLGQGTSAIIATAAMTNGQVLIGVTSADPAPVTLSGSIVSVSSAGAVVSRESWNGGSATTVSASAVSYFPAQGKYNSEPVAAEGAVLAKAANPGTVTNLRCDSVNGAGTLTVAGGTAYTIAFQKGKGGGASALTCPITALINTCSDTTHSVSLVAGDLYDIMVTPTGTPTALVLLCSVEFQISG